VGDVDTQFINLNYMALIGRKRGDLELTLKWTQRTLTHVDRTRNMFYKVHALGSLAWVHLRIGEHELAQTYLQEGLAIIPKFPNPLGFMIWGPALAIEVGNKNWELAVNHAKSLLQPSQQKLPDDIQATLEQVIACWEAGNVKSTGVNLIAAIELMNQKQMGYV